MVFQFPNKIAVILAFYSLITFLLCVISSGKFSHEAGSQKFVSWLNAAAGLVGSYFILSIAKIMVPVPLFKLPIFFGLPTLCALLYWSQDWKALRILMATACVMLFVVHPIGYYAAPYTLFWFIPMVIALLPHYTVLKALGSTFTAHAVGSVMHLYLFNTLSAEAWIALIPLVIIERSILAVSALIGYLLACKVCDTYKAACLQKTYVCK